jgi:glycosyltransferase involved in cell wall biosynthesis
MTTGGLSVKKIIRRIVTFPVIKQTLGFFVKVFCKVINACIKRSFIHIDYAPAFKTLKNKAYESYDDMNRMWNYTAALIGYFTADIKDNTILLIEPNDCHGEVIPGFAKYLLDLGYAVDIIMIWELSWMQPLCRFNDPGIRTIVIPHSFINDLFDKPVIKKYKKIVLSSFRVYRHSNTAEGMEIFECYPNVKNHTDRLIAVEHHAEKCNGDMLNQNRVITLESFEYARKAGVCNPHYFGAVKAVSKSRTVTKFIAVGKIETERRNHYLLIDAVKELKKQKITNFKIIIIGLGAMPDVSAGIRCFFEFRGWVDFPAMYSAMEEADFFLPLLDMDLPAHKRYIDRATSGSFQLIYGFTKPCLIQRSFAPKRGLTEKNSLLYDKNSDLAGTMLKAIEMTGFEYEDMREDLQKLAEKIYADSKNNLKRIIDEE